jgi:hypothetical protein
MATEDFNWISPEIGSGEIIAIGALAATIFTFYYSNVRVKRYDRYKVALSHLEIIRNVRDKLHDFYDRDFYDSALNPKSDPEIHLRVLQWHTDTTDFVAEAQRFQYLVARGLIKDKYDLLYFVNYLGYLLLYVKSLIDSMQTTDIKQPDEDYNTVIDAITALMEWCKSLEKSANDSAAEGKIKRLSSFLACLRECKRGYTPQGSNKSR